MLYTMFTGYRELYSTHIIQDTAYRILHTGYRIQDTAYRDKYVHIYVYVSKERYLLVFL